MGVGFTLLAGGLNNSVPAKFLLAPSAAAVSVCIVAVVALLGSFWHPVAALIRRFALAVRGIADQIVGATGSGVGTAGFGTTVIVSATFAVIAIRRTTRPTQAVDAGLTAVTGIVITAIGIGSARLQAQRGGGIETA